MTRPTFRNPVNQAVIRPYGASAVAGNFRVTLPFGPTDVAAERDVDWPGGEGIPAGKYPLFHQGLDLGDRKCGAPVVASAPGKVTAAGVLVYTERGKTYRPNRVIVDHGGGWTTEYWHLLDVVARAGQSLGAGALLGHVGKTGNTNACHLHFVIRHNGRVVDPWRRLEQNDRRKAQRRTEG